MRRKSIKYSFLPGALLIFALNIFAHTADTKPELTIDCPQDRINAGEKIRLTASVKPDTPNIIFNWNISAGTIENGQGSSTVEIRTSDAADDLEVSVQISGKSELESVTAKCSIHVYARPRPLLIRESDYIRYEGGWDGLHHSRYILDPVVTDLRANPAGELYIVIYAKDRTGATARKVAGAKKELEFVLFTLHKLPRDSVRVVDGGFGKELMRYYIVPEGVEDPAIEVFPELTPQNTVNANPSACELNGLYLESLQRELANEPHQSIKIVFSPGKTETAAVNAKRQKIFMDKIKNRFSDVETAIGEKTEGDGEVTIYLRKSGGKEDFYLLIYAIKNRSICLNCCDPSDMPKNLAIEPKKRSVVKKKQKK